MSESRQLPVDQGGDAKAHQLGVNQGGDPDALQLGVNQGGDPEALRYGSGGVDIDVSNAAKRRIRKLVESTFTKGVVGDFGGFGEGDEAD